MGDYNVLSYAEIAKLSGLSVATLRGYKSAGMLPAPDAASSLPDRPRWKKSTIVHWLANRPGSGAPGRPRRPSAGSEPA